MQAAKKKKKQKKKLFCSFPSVFSQAKETVLFKGFFFYDDAAADAVPATCSLVSLLLLLPVLCSLNELVYLKNLSKRRKRSRYL